jgi:dihydroorotate dehydrogenase
MVTSLSTCFGRVAVEGVVGNSPGLRKTIEETEKLIESATPVVMFGSITRNKRMGNAGNVFYEDDLYTQNWIGLANLGIEAYLPDLIRLSKLCKEAGKEFVVSLAAELLEELLEMVEMLVPLEISLELNLTCPNVSTEQGFPVIWSYDHDLTRDTLQAVRHLFKGNLGVKLNYHPDWRYIRRNAQIMVDGGVDYIALINTLPKSVIPSPETLRPQMGGTLGQGGLSGPAILPLALGAVEDYRAELPDSFPIVGEGGATSGYDVLCFLVYGAQFVRLGRVYGRRGVPGIGETLIQYLGEMEKRGFRSLADIPPFPPEKRG